MRRHNFASRKKARQERALNNLVARIRKDEDDTPERKIARRKERALLTFLLFGDNHKEQAHG